jgi:KaiC/GvpD/RAD55 family RecA-like ATPase
MIELTKTGIDGLDDILNGGIVKNSTTLVSGNPGAGKSILGLQYIYNGVEMFDEDGIFLTFEESAEDLRQAAESIGFDNWQQYVDEGRITVYDKQVLLRENDFSSSLELLLGELDDDNYERLVLDSLTMFKLFFDTEREQRTYLLKFTDILADNELTTLMTNEQGQIFPETEINLENFLTDGNIYLIQTPTDSGVSRYVWVAKMRKQNIETDIFPMEIVDGGITVHQNASAFSMMSENDSPLCPPVLLLRIKIVE